MNGNGLCSCLFVLITATTTETMTNVEAVTQTFRMDTSPKLRRDSQQRLYDLAVRSKLIRFDWTWMVDSRFSRLLSVADGKL